MKSDDLSKYNKEYDHVFGVNMKQYEYFTVFADSAASFTEAVNRKGKLGWQIDRFEYKESIYREKGEKALVLQCYVGIMVRTSKSDNEVTDVP